MHVAVYFQFQLARLDNLRDSGECIQPSFIQEEKHILNRGLILCVACSTYDEWLRSDECARCSNVQGYLPFFTV